MPATAQRSYDPALHSCPDGHLCGDNCRCACLQICCSSILPAPLANSAPTPPRGQGDLQEDQRAWLRRVGAID